MAAITLSIALQKGGVGKSTTSQALASTLGHLGKKVLLIDMDSQSNVSYASGSYEFDYTIFDVLGGGCKTRDAIVNLNLYDLIPANQYLSRVEMAEDVEPTLLKAALAEIQEDYDFVVIDTPPALGNLSFNSLVASDYLIITSDPRPFSLQGLGSLNETIETVKNGLNPNLKVLGILLVKHHERSVLNRDLKAMIKDYTDQMNTCVFETHIREGIAVPESQTVRVPLIEYAPKSNPCIDYIEFTKEVLRKIGE